MTRSPWQHINTHTRQPSRQMLITSLLVFERKKKIIGDVSISIIKHCHFPENQQVISKQFHYCDIMLCMQTAILISDWQRHMALLIIKKQPQKKVSFCYINATNCSLASRNTICFHEACKYCIMNVNLKEAIKNTATFSIYNWGITNKNSHAKCISWSESDVLLKYLLVVCQMFTVPRSPLSFG